MTRDSGSDAAWQQHYSQAPVVTSYRRGAVLQPPETAIFALLRAELAQARVLDIGMGAGRTSEHVAPACRHYTGVDYAAAMVAACQQRFRGHPWCGPQTFGQADARELPFDDASFDFVLFSFNGIDCVPRADRARAFAQCRRVLRAGGWLVWSSHNLNWVDGHGPLPRRSGWRDWLEDHQYRRRMLRMNAALGPLAGHQELELLEPPDGLSLYYARPAEHLRQARALGLEAIRVFDGRGRDITEAPDRDRRRDAWLYFAGRA